MTSLDAVPWKGDHISQLQTSLNLSQFPELVSNEEHTILFRIPVRFEKVPECFPSIFNKRDFWDSQHVKLPCSDKNVTRDQISRWDMIRHALTSQISSSKQLQAAILSYNARYAEQWNFATLHMFFDALDEVEAEMFFETLLPKIIELALRLPELITGGIPLLKQGHRHSVSLSQLQISCLLANAFLCTFPHRNNNKKDAEYFEFPNINFIRLFQCYHKNRMQSVLEKIKCILNYFRRVTSNVPTGVVTYSRQLIPNNLYPNWSKSNRKLPRVYISSEGTIEDDGFGLFQVDFANKFVGGGVIGTGCVQEEIRFVICPELILSRLFTQCLGENEALVITGCERFNKYKGYGSSFLWDGDYVDGTPSDEYGRKYCTVIALDALRFAQNPNDQYLPKNILRDLNKAYVGFSWGSRQKKESLCAVATGNWGCGAFKGDPELKSFLQLMAAGEVGRDLAYFTFGNVELRDGLAATYKFLVENEVAIGKLYNLLGEYHSNELFNTISVFEFFRREALRKTEIIEMESDISKMNISQSLRPLEITKKRSFCYRTKVSDWFRPVNGTNSSENGVNLSISETSLSRIVDEESKLSSEMRKSESEILKNFYQLPKESQNSTTTEVQSPKSDCFEFLNRFKESMKRKTLMTNKKSNPQKDDSKEEGSCEVTQDENGPNTNDIHERTYINDSIVNCSFSNEEKVSEFQPPINIGSDSCFEMISNSSDTNSTVTSKVFENCKSENSSKMSISRDEDVTKNIHVKNIEAKFDNSCFPQVHAFNDTISMNGEENETETEISVSNVAKSSCNLVEKSTSENDVRGRLNVHIYSKSENFEKENINRNRVETLSSLAARQRQQSKTPKRGTPTSSSKQHVTNCLSNSKKRKISDYYSPKPM